MWKMVLEAQQTEPRSPSLSAKEERQEAAPSARRRCLEELNEARFGSTAAALASVRGKQRHLGQSPIRQGLFISKPRHSAGSGLAINTSPELGKRLIPTGVDVWLMQNWQRGGRIQLSFCPIHPYIHPSSIHPTHGEPTGTFQLWYQAIRI